MSVRLQKIAGQWCLDDVENSQCKIWEDPPVAVDRLLTEMFSAKPEDCLSWVHYAIWQMRTEELIGAGTLQHQADSPEAMSEAVSTTATLYHSDVRVNAAAAAMLEDIAPLPSASKARVSSISGSSGKAKDGRPESSNEQVALNAQQVRPLKRHVSQDDSGIGFNGVVLEEKGLIPRMVRQERIPEEFHEIGWKEKEQIRDDDLESSNLSDALHLHDSKQNVMSQDLHQNVLTPRPFWNKDSLGSDQTDGDRDSQLDWKFATADSKLAEREAALAELGFEKKLSSPREMRWDLTGSVTSSHVVDSGFEKYFGVCKSGRNMTPEVTSLTAPSSQAPLPHPRQHDGSRDACNYVLNPAGRVRLCWDCIFLNFLLYEVWATPFELVYIPDEENLPAWLEVASMISLCFFTGDIVLNFLTGYIEGGAIVLDKRKIARNYLRSWFWFDLAATLPGWLLASVGNTFDMARFLRGIKFYKLMKALRLLRTLRLVKTSGITNSLLGYFELKPNRVFAMQLLQLILAILFLAHFHGCMWGSLQPSEWRPSTNNDSFNPYLESVWLTIPALTLGSEMPAVSNGQRFLAIMMSIERYAIVVITIKWLMWRSMLLRRAADHQSLREGALAYLKHHKMGSTVQMRVFQTMNETGDLKRWVLNFGAMAEEMFPLPLRRLIYLELWSKRLRSLDLIKIPAKTNPEFVQELSLLVREEIIASQVVVFEVDEPSNLAFCVLQGKLGVTLDLQSESVAPIPDFTSGMWVGEKALVNPELRHLQTIVCKVVCELMALSAIDFHASIKKFDLKAEFDELLRSRLWHGLCGRCGTLGDHFGQNCPTIKWEGGSSRPSRLKGPSTRFSLSSRHADVQNPEPAEFLPGYNGDMMDLARFLQRQELSHLLPAMAQHGIFAVKDLTVDSIKELREDPEVDLTEEQWQVLSLPSRKDYHRRILRTTTKVLSSNKDSVHFVFISHYKLESGTEAALMKEDLLRIFVDDKSHPGHSMPAAVFLDTEELRDLNQLRQHVRQSHNLLFLLTPGLLLRPWCLIEVVEAYKAGVKIVPVEVQRRGISFEYPDEDFWQSLRNGQFLDPGSNSVLQKENIQLADVEAALRQVFDCIAMPFSPHKTANVRQAEIRDILRNCSMIQKLDEDRQAEARSNRLSRKSGATEAFSIK